MMAFKCPLKSQGLSKLDVLIISLDVESLVLCLKETMMF